MTTLGPFRLLSLAALLACSPAAVAGYYLGGGVQQGSLEDAYSNDALDDAPGGRLHAGLELSDTLAFEAAIEGWDHAFGDAEDDYEESIRPGVSMGFRARMPVTERFSITSSMGAHHWTARAYDNSDLVGERGEASGVDWFYTLGTRMRLQDAWEIGLERYRYNNGDGFGNEGVYNLSGFRFTASYFPEGRLQGTGGMGLEQVMVRGGLVTSLQSVTDEYADDDTSDLTPGVEATLGYLLLPTLSFELGYRILGEAQFDVAPDFEYEPGALAGFGLSAVRLKGVTAGFAYEAWREDKLALFVRSGVFSWALEQEYRKAVNGTAVSAVDPYIGGGLTYQLNDRLAFYTDYTRYSADVAASTVAVNALSVGVEYMIGQSPRFTASRATAEGWKPWRSRLSEGSGGAGRTVGMPASHGSDDDAADEDSDDGGEATACDPRYRDMFFDCD